MSRLLLLFVIALLAACGQKGPLYLPAPAPAVSVPGTPAVGPAQVIPVPALPGTGAPAAGAAERAAPGMVVPPAPDAESESRERALPAAQP